ncbi:stage II sporulation protein P [Bacillus testis]|uniref:stage II sporulation protein P n=1 Tax=Bacillus testis TaxID=1622072 RepID=UPI00084118A9|nr:stage II sporulation protein P [Bacillus testis]
MERISIIRKKIINSFTITLIAASIVLYMLILNYSYGSRTIEKMIDEVQGKDLFTYFFQTSNHFYFAEENNPFSAMHLTDLFFSLAANVKPTDARSYLINQIPGLADYDTEILVAGEGTNITNLPVEPHLTETEQKNESPVAEEKVKTTSDTAPPAAKKTYTLAESDIFIYQSHNRESFLPFLKGTNDPDKASSSDQRANVVKIGSLLAEQLIANGLKVYHDTTDVNKKLVERNMNYYHSYDISGEIVKAASAQNTKMQYFIDVHRDAARKKLTTKVINGKSYARLYFIIGKENKDYQKNLEFTKKINSALEEKYPGLSRGVLGKSRLEGNGVYNQNISDKAILVELGGVDNTMDELNRTIKALADAYTAAYNHSIAVNKQ